MIRLETGVFIQGRKYGLFLLDKELHDENEKTLKLRVIEWLMKMDDQQEKAAEKNDKPGAIYFEQAALSLAEAYDEYEAMVEPATLKEGENGTKI